MYPEFVDAFNRNLNLTFALRDEKQQGLPARRWAHLAKRRRELFKSDPKSTSQTALEGRLTEAGLSGPTSDNDGDGEQEGNHSLTH
jgi:hypothetical protein